MQLAVFLTILMLVGQKNFSQLKPIIEEFGGEEVKSAMGKAEELNQIIATVNSLTSVQGGEERSAYQDNQPIKTERTSNFNHPLEPIKAIADERTLSAFSKLIALGE